MLKKIILGFCAFAIMGGSQAYQNEQIQAMPVAQQLKEKYQQENMVKENRWDNTKNYIKRGFQGSCTDDCLKAPGDQVCKNPDKKAWCTKNCHGKYKIVETGKLFDIEEKCPSSMGGQMKKGLGNLFK